MPLFVSEAKNYRVGLKKGYVEIINGNKVVRKPVKARFKNYMFDTESSRAKKLPLDEEEIVKKLRKNKFYNSDFWEKERDAITLDKLKSDTIRDLQDYIKEVDDLSMLKQALDAEREKEEPRKLAVEMFKNRLKDILGEIE